MDFSHFPDCSNSLGVFRDEGGFKRKLEESIVKKVPKIGVFRVIWGFSASGFAVKSSGLNR